MLISKNAKNLFLCFIYIIHKQLKNINNENKNFKAKIYHMLIKTIF